MVIANDYYQSIGIWNCTSYVSNQRAFNMSRVSGRSVLILLTYQVILRNFEKKSNQIYLAAQNNPYIYIYTKKTIPWEKFIISVAVKDFFTQFIVFTQEDSAYAANFVTIFAICLKITTI